MQRLRDGIKRSTSSIKDKMLDVRDTITNNIIPGTSGSGSPAISALGASSSPAGAARASGTGGPTRRRSSGADLEEEKRQQSEEKLNQLETEYMEEVFICPSLSKNKPCVIAEHINADNMRNDNL